jgi:UDP-glucose 4-epimerase
VIGTGIKTSVNGIYRELVKISGFKAPITAGPKREGDPRDAQFDAAGAKKALKWKPVTKLADGMLETYEFFKAAPR